MTEDITTEPATRVQLPLDQLGSGTLAYAPVTQACALATVAHATEARAAHEFAALAVLLYRYTQQSQITIETRGPGKDSLGFRLLSLVLAADMPAAEIVAQAQTALEKATPTQAQGAGNIAIDWSPAPPGKDARYDLRLVLAGAPHLVCNGNALGHASIARLADNLARVFQAIETEPDTPVAALPLMGENELAVVTADGPQLPAGYTPHSVREDFARHCALFPDAPAVHFAGASLSYRELDQRSNRLARHLVARTVEPGAAVAVCLRPSFEQLIAIMAVFKAGAVYVPVDPAHPANLVRLIFEQACPALVVTDATVRDVTANAGVPQLELDTHAAQLADIEATPLEIPVDLDAPCYILFTSGTTGKPKGVAATHRNLAHYLYVAREMYRFGPQDVFCSIARHTFSISMFDLLSPLTCGGSVRLLERDQVLHPERFCDVLRQVSVLHAGPSLLSSVFHYLRANPSAREGLGGLRHVSSGGDIVPPHVLEEAKCVFPQAEIYVIYGCTEISCMGCTYAVVRDQTVERSYVGKPFPSVQVRVLDAQHKPLPIGAVGEICFAGQGLVPGYLNRPDLDAEKFLDLQGRRFYQTGDLGRFDGEGRLEILGRRDFQVQIRGMRVELAGIENCVRSLGLAAQCAVVLKRLDDQDMRLVAFLVQPSVEVESVRRRLSEHLPDYMLPQHVVVLDALPLTPNGKLDRRALQALPFRPQRSGGAAPRTFREKQIAEGFCEALELANVGIDDDFFDLGGHSLLAVQLMERLEHKLGMAVSPGAIFEAPTVRTLAEALDSDGPAAHRPLRLTRDDSAPALFLVAAVQKYRELARLMEGKYTVYAVFTVAELALFEADSRVPPIQTLASQYVEIIRRQQPHGPYRLGGLSFGGVIAYEAAQQLRASGEEVCFLGLIDSVLPERGLTGRLAMLRRVLTMDRVKLGKAIAASAQVRFERLLRGRRVAEFGEFKDESEFSEMELKREDAYHAACAQYGEHVRPWPGQITVFAAGKRLQAEPQRGADCGWARFAAQLDIHVVDSDHHGLVYEPRVRDLSALMLKCLTRADSARQPPRERGCTHPTHAQA